MIVLIKPVEIWHKLNITLNQIIITNPVTENYLVFYVVLYYQTNSVEHLNFYVMPIFLLLFFYIQLGIEN